MTIEVIAGSRIHVSLADMGFASPRSYGGVGFMIDRAAAHIEFNSDNNLIIEGAASLDERAQHEVESLLRELAKRADTGAAVRIISHGLQHVGLGTKTALKLSLVAGYSRMRNDGASRLEQQALSGRGGTSGIGVHGFFEGGVIWDGGRPRADVLQLVPSSNQTPGAPPPLMLRLPFPEIWEVDLCLPEMPTIDGTAERAFFLENTPVDQQSTLRAMGELYHGILPAFRLADLATLSAVLSAIAREGFKRLEVSRYGNSVRLLLDKLGSKGYAAGMSSMGPLVYVIRHKDDLEANAAIQSICRDSGVTWLGKHRGLNQAATVRSVEYQ